jgi:hypothetical protein
LQNDIILFDFPLEEELPYPFYDFGKLSAYVPGWESTTVDSRYPGEVQRFPLVRRNSTLDYFDISTPKFSKCQTPVIWAAPWLAAYGEFYLNNVVPLWVVQQQLGLFDREVILSPMLAGFQAPKHVYNLLKPFSDIIIPFDELGSRVRAYQNLPRCFENMILCRLKGIYDSRPPPKYPVDNETVPYVGGHFTYDGDKDWVWWKGAYTGQFVSRFTYIFFCFVVCMMIWSF